MRALPLAIAYDVLIVFSKYQDSNTTHVFFSNFYLTFLGKFSVKLLLTNLTSAINIGALPFLK